VSLALFDDSNDSHRLVTMVVPLRGSAAPAMNPMVE
jgi:hypothetical protein